MAIEPPDGCIVTWIIQIAGSLTHQGYLFAVYNDLCADSSPQLDTPSLPEKKQVKLLTRLPELRVITSAPNHCRVQMIGSPHK